jgi:hypothetical protein
MVPQEKVDMVQALEATRDEFIGTLEGVTEEQARRSPEPGRWSVLQCVEHIAIAEERFVARIEQGEPVEPPAENPDREAEFLARVPDRTVRRNAPEPVQPAGRYATLAEAIEGFKAARERSIALAKEQGRALYSKAITHPVFGPLNGVETVILIAGHARRHAGQIREIKAALAAR